MIHKGRLASLENAPLSTLWARKRYRIGPRFRQYLRATNCYKLSDQLNVTSTRFEHCEQRHPIDPGRLHHHGRNLTLPQPRGQGVEVGGQRPKPLPRLRIPICGHGDPMRGRPNSNPSSLEVQLLSRRHAHPTGAPLLWLAPACTTYCMCPL